jgi:type I restriction enzyme S subunit
LGGFLFRLFQSTGVSYQLHTEANGVTRYGLSQGAIKSVWLGLPPLPEQAAIVQYLDYVDRRIRSYIGAKQKLIKLLDEQKQAVIHRAVTHGLDPNVCLKPSGVEWLGDVPEHWAVKRLKWVTRLQRGYDLPADSRVPGPYAVVSSGGVIDYHCEPRSRGPGVVMGRYGSTDAVFFIQEDFWPHNTALFVTDFQGNRPRWCYYLLRTISKADHAGKSAVPGVDRKDLYQIMVPVPPVSEQDVLVVEIETESADLDKAMSSANHEISLLSEYRTRLIADLVTGKLDVREAVASLPDETGEQERILDDAAPFIEDDLEDDDLGLEAALEEVEA